MPKIDCLRAIRLGGVNFAVSDLHNAVAWTLEGVQDGSLQGKSIRFSNAYSVACAQADRAHQLSLNSPGATFPDGAPVAATMRLLARGACAPQRVRGPSFFEEALERCAGLAIEHAFVGSSRSTLELLERSINEKYPWLDHAEFYAPPFLEDPTVLAEDILKNVRLSRKLVWLGLGTPKQDLVAAILASRTDCTFAAVGAAFDFLAGTLPRAPIWMQDSGMEWLFRFVSEPRRLWRRYLLGNSTFLRVAASEIAGAVLRGPRMVR